MFNEGMIVMRIFATKLMFKDYYHTQPSEQQILLAVTFIPWVLRPLMGIIIDSKLIAHRKWYLIVFGIVATISQIFIGVYIFKELWQVCLLIFIYNFGAAFIDSAM